MAKAVTGYSEVTVLGAVLAGGRSRRFGSDKGAALLGGRRLIDHAATALAAHVDKVVIVGRVEPGRESLADRPCPDMGPLGGLNAALHHAAGLGFAGVLTLGCDMPLLPPAVAQALIGPTAAVLHRQHLVGYWPSGLATRLDAHLAEGEDRSIRTWLAVARPMVVGAGWPPLPNINTTDELAVVQSGWPVH